MKHGQGKRAKIREQKKRKKAIIKSLIIIIVLVSISFFVLPNLFNMKDQTVSEEIVEEFPTIESPLVEEDKSIEYVDVSNIPKTKEGYTVIGEIVIEKINIKSYILGRTDNKSLNLGITKFWGPSINNPGNLCLMGHNYKNYFGLLNTLNIGDTFYIVGMDGRKITYQITKQITKVNSKDMSHIEQNEDGIRKVTLITCDKRRTHKIYRKSRTKKGKYG